MKAYLAPLILSVLACQTAASSLDVQLDGIRSAKGKVIVSLFSQSKAFAAADMNQAKVLTIQQAIQGSMRFRFSNLSVGEYALIVHHDENDDGRLNEKEGIPLEGYGFSQGLGKQAAPSFDVAKLTINEGMFDSQVRLIYQ